MDKNHKKEYEFGRALRYNKQGKNKAEQHMKEIEQEYAYITNQAEKLYGYKEKVAEQQTREDGLVEPIKGTFEYLMNGATFDKFVDSHDGLPGNGFEIKFRQRGSWLNSLQRFAAIHQVYGMYIFHKPGFFTEDAGYYFVCGLDESIIDPNMEISIDSLNKRQAVNAECIFLDAMAFKITGVPELVTLHAIYEYIVAIEMIKNADEKYLPKIISGEYPNMMDQFAVKFFTEQWAIYKNVWNTSVIARKEAKKVMDEIINGDFAKRGEKKMLTLPENKQEVKADLFKKYAPNYYTVYEVFSTAKDYDTFKSKFIEKMKEYPEIHFAFDKKDYRDMTPDERRQINWTDYTYLNPYANYDYSFHIMYILYEGVYHSDILYVIDSIKYGELCNATPEEVTANFGFASIDVPNGAIELFCKTMRGEVPIVNGEKIIPRHPVQFCIDNGIVKKPTEYHVVPFLVSNNGFDRASDFVTEYMDFCVRSHLAVNKHGHYVEAHDQWIEDHYDGKDRLAWGAHEAYDKNIAKEMKAMGNFDSDDIHYREHYIQDALGKFEWGWNPDSDLYKDYSKGYQYDEITEEDMEKLAYCEEHGYTPNDYFWLAPLGLNDVYYRNKFIKSWEYQEWYKKYKNNQ